MRRDRLDAATWLLTGVGIGAGMSYLLDPRQGRRRRAMLRDGAVHLLKRQRDVLEKGARDLSHRATGKLGAQVRALTSDGEVDDVVLLERVRAELGRCASHPSAIEVHVHDGCVTLAGPVLASEARHVLRAIGRVRGVQGVEDRLERHRAAGRIAALQGEGRTPRPLLQREVWPPSTRILAIGTGLALGGYGLARRGILGAACSLAGGALLVRATTNLPTSRLVGAGAGEGAVQLQKSIYVDAPVEEVFELWTHLENFPRFMQHVRQVHCGRRDPSRSHWVVDGPLGIPVRFDAEVTRHEENRAFAWKSLPNPLVEHAGTVHFAPERDGTRVHVHMSYTPAGGAIGHALLRLFGEDPRSLMDDDLIRMKSLLEQGETRAHGERVRLEQLQPL